MSFRRINRGEVERWGVSCRICRKRKVKCDRTPGGCNRCRRFGQECVYSTEPISRSDYTTDVDLESTQAGLKRRRCARSCISCRRSKEKCSGDAICVRCTKKGIECSYFDPVTENLASSTIEISIPAWLTAQALPSSFRLRKIVEIYFVRVHTVRCMGFLHMPTFMEHLKLEDPTQMPSERLGLLHAMCALAAPFYCAEILEISEDNPQIEICLFEAGKGWAEAAREILSSNFGKPQIESLMTEVLLHEYYLRVGEYAKSFMLSGQIARHLQVMQLHLESDSDLLCEKSPYSPSSKESRRRLAWACYILDAYIECGIDQLQFITSEDVQVQLPCLEDMFIRSMACITETLPCGKLLPFVDRHSNTDYSAQLDLRSFYIRGIYMRSKILRFVKHLEGEVPWSDNRDSKFSQLESKLQEFETSIPEIFRMSPGNLYLFKAVGRLNLFFGLHILISQNFYDLYRVGVSNLVFPDTATRWIRENAPSTFIRKCHLVCFQKATYIASLLKDLWECDKTSLIDTPFAMHAQVCSSVLVTTLTSWQENDILLPDLSLLDCQAILQTNVEILQYLQRYMKVDMYRESAMHALDRFIQLFALNSDGLRTLGLNENTAHVQAERLKILRLEYVLNPLGTYPMARKQAIGGTQQLVLSGEAENQAVSKGSESESETLTNGTSMDEIYAFSDPTYQFGDDATVDWDPEMFMIQGLGYPTFLGQEI